MRSNVRRKRENTSSRPARSSSNSASSIPPRSRASAPPARRSLKSPSPLASPDLAAVGADHRVAGLAGEGAGELLEVRGRADRAEAAERVWIGVDDQPRELRAVVGGPDPRPGEEEALVGGQAVDGRRRRLALEALHEGAVGDRDAS